MSNERSSGRPTRRPSARAGSPALLLTCNPTVASLPATIRLREEVSRSTSAAKIVFPAPAEVWEALTDPEQLEDWFATEVELEPRPGGRGVFRWGNGEERSASVKRSTRSAC